MPSQAGYPWQGLLTDCVDEMMRVVKEGEEFIYDTMMPSLLALQSPAQRKAFYNTVDWDALKVRSGALWSRMTNDSLSLDDADRKDQEQKLADLNRLEGQQDTAFRPQVQLRPVLGMREPGSRQSTQTTGMDLPMGVLGGGA